MKKGREPTAIVSVTVTDSRETEIADAIQSVVDHVDRVLIVDTGITDGTLDRAAKIAKGKLAVTKHTWVDFSAARNAGLESAKALGAAWIVIVDSDERLNFGELTLRNELAKTQTDVLLIESDDGHYPKEKIIRASANLRYVGPTHETLIGGSRETLRGMTFYELPKSNERLRLKFERDVKILSEHVEKHPDDPRWWYYLGASYEGTGDRFRSAAAFGECVSRRRIGVEAAWAAYKQAEQLFILEQYHAAIDAAVRGMGADATFAECAWIAAVSSYKIKRTDQSIAWARIAIAVGRYKGCGPDRAWFRHMPALYELPYDVLRSALSDEKERQQANDDFYAAKLARIGVSDEGNLDHLSISRDVPESNRHEARSMLRPPPLEDLCPSVRFTRIAFEPPNGYHPMNPSICTHKGELWCVVRTVNYKIKNGVYDIGDYDGIVRTENYLGRLQLDGNFVEPPHRMVDLDASPRQPSQIVGYEDIRLISLGNVLSGSSTVCDRNASRRQMARLDFDVSGDIRQAEVQKTNQLHEKNWMPISVDGEFAWIYSLDPTAVVPGPLRKCPFALEHLRGGAAIPFEDGYLCVTHEVVESNEGRVYLHRFVQLDEAFNVIGVSAAWIFNHYGIEFCAGLVQIEDDFVISYGLEDGEAWIARVSVSDVADRLKWFSAEPIISPTPSKRNATRRLRVTVVNSPYDRCGVREYGIQLNRSLSDTVELTETTFSDISVSALTSSDVTLVHFENGLVSHDFHRILSDAKNQGARTVFCCHNYRLDYVVPFLPLVDRFVLHRFYDDVPPNSVEIPLGCPVYVPGENREQIRARLALPKDRLVITSLGFLADWKRWGEIVEAVAAEISDIAFLQINTAIPFWPNHETVERDTARVRAALVQGLGQHSIEFLPERELLDRVYASDLGFVFHPIHTGSVSAATKQFVSARCPLVVTGSSHASDLDGGVVRVESFDPHVFAREVRRVAADKGLHARMREGMAREYDRLNMDVTAARYVQLFKEITSK